MEVLIRRYGVIPTVSIAVAVVIADVSDSVASSVVIAWNFQCSSRCGHT